MRYAEERRKVASSSFLLRRNTHRLEKGLLMRPRRSSFAADYIGETVEAFERTLRAAPDEWEANSEVSWANDVLSEYFSVVDDSDPAVEKARRRFSGASPSDPSDVRQAVPYRRDLSKPLAVSFDSFMDLCRRRRSVRWYLDRPVPRELVDRALQAAAQSPSACNRQPFTFRIFDDRESVRRIASIPLGTRGFGDSLPAVAVLVGRLRAYPLARDRHAIYVDGALASMTFMFALETLGLASCPLNWADQEPQESLMREALKLEPDERVIMCIAYGWPDPDGMVAYSAKRPLEQLRSFD
jgi:nitroreductase